MWLFFVREECLWIVPEIISDFCVYKSNVVFDVNTMNSPLFISLHSRLDIKQNCNLIYFSLVIPQKDN